MSGVKAGSSTSDSTSLRAATERAQNAEKRAQNATNQLAMLEQRLAEMQAKSGLAENKWEARVKEYENRLRIAGEKIKTEKQGGKERARELEAQVRCVGHCPADSLVADETIGSWRYRWSRRDGGISGPRESWRLQPTSCL